MSLLRAGLLFFALTCLTSSATAQQGVPSDPATYFPLEEGNTWTYFQTLHPPGGEIDTLFWGPFTVTGEVALNDTTYVVAPHAFGFTDHLRSDGEGRIYGRIDGRDVLIFDFTLGDGEQYPFRRNEVDDPYVVTVQKDVQLQLHSGRFVNAAVLSFDIPEYVDEEVSFTFVPGFGIVRATGQMGDYYELYSGVVGGQPLPTHVSRDIPGSRDFIPYAYPNPFQRKTTLVVDGPSRLYIFDLLGRKVRTLEIDYCPDRCEVTWDAGRIAPGLYFARIISERVGRTISLIAR